MVYAKLLKSESAQGAISCFSFEPRRGLTAGIRLVVGMPTQRNNGSFYPPHVRSGDNFVNIDNVHAPDLTVRGKDTIVMRASLRIVEPTSGAKPFPTLSKKGQDGVLLFIETAFVRDEHYIDKIDPDLVRAWSGIIIDDTVEVVAGDQQVSSSRLLRFTGEGQTAEIFLKSGLVCRIVQKSGSLTSEPLSRADMARLRVEQAEKQMATLGDSEQDLKRRHGILGGIVRLLGLTAGEPEVREVFVAMLRQYIDGRLTTKMQEEVRSLLLSWNDPAAAFFVEGGGNLVDLSMLRTKFMVTERKGPPSEVKAKKAERAAKDRERTAKTRGTSSGKPTVSANPKKSATRAKKTAARK